MYRAAFIAFRTCHLARLNLGDEISIVAEMERAGNLESVGGKRFIGNLYHDAGLHSGANIETEISTLKQYTRRRQLAEALVSASTLLQKGEDGAAVDALKAVTAVQRATSTPPYHFVGSLIDKYTCLRRPLVHGLLREGETMNVIAPPKTGKTWLTLDFALSVATGLKWLGFDVAPGRVLILDNELHAETIGNRLPRVAEAKGIARDRYENKIAYELLRGNLKDIFTLGPMLNALEPGYFSVIVLDAFYRFLPKDTDENDNGSMAGLYNQIDAYAEKLHCAFVLIHHTSKGLQSGRAVTDVGAGAGAISRAADCHVILRPHSEEAAVVLDAAPRSWPPVLSRCLRFEFPLWTPAPDLDPTEFKRANAKAKKPEVSSTPTEPAKVEWTTTSFVAALISQSPKLKGAILADANEKGLTDYKAVKFLEKAEATGQAFRWSNGGNKPPSFATIPQPKLDLQPKVTGGECESVFPLKETLRGNSHSDTHPRRKTKSQGSVTS